MNKRPKIKPALTTADKVFENLGVVVIVAIWYGIITNYGLLPDIIPIHFNGAGKADGYGAKSNILILPIIATVIYLGLTQLNKYPYVFNYAVKITEENALRQYTLATRMIRYLKCIVVMIFGFISLQTIRNVKGQSLGLGTWFLPISVVLIFVPMIYFVLKSIKKQSKEE